MEYQLFSLPKQCLWLRMSVNARFHDRPSWPELRRWKGVDLRIMKLAAAMRDKGAVVCFYQMRHRPDLPTWQKEAMQHICIEVVNPAATGTRFLPTWLGHTYEDRKANLDYASVIYLSKAST